MRQPEMGRDLGGTTGLGSAPRAVCVSASRLSSPTCSSRGEASGPKDVKGTKSRQGHVRRLERQVLLKCNLGNSADLTVWAPACETFLVRTSSAIGERCSDFIEIPTSTGFGPSSLRSKLVGVWVDQWGPLET